MPYFFPFIFCVFLIASCSSPQHTEEKSNTNAVQVNLQDTLPSSEPITIPSEVIEFDYDTTKWTEMIALDSTFILDIRYATDSNFVGQVMYDCARCFLRPKVAQALLGVHQELKTEGLHLKLFDCYRPRDVQWKLWEIMPQPGYVADPRKGSIHNRGCAVDLTIARTDGSILDMGTDFDFFGPEANHFYTDLPDSVLVNRQKLKTLMVKHGFSPIRSEWWHYNFKGERYSLEDEEWNCLEEKNRQ